MFDPHQVKLDFPILQRQLNGKSLVYLDSAATSQKPRSVIQAITDYYEQHNANVHRGVHQLGDESTQLFHQSRRTIARFFKVDPTELVVVRNTTEAINLVADRWVAPQLQAGDVILATEMEHHSNIVPWQMVAERTGARVVFAKVTSNGTIDLNDFEHHLQLNAVKVVAFTHVSNTLGTLNPLDTLVNLTRTHNPNALIVVDGAQAAPHLPLTLSQLDVDVYVVSAHKMLGPMGIGGLFVKKQRLEKLSPLLYGGGMIGEVFTDHCTFAEDLEERFTAGTPDVASLVGWAAACEYLEKLGMTEVAEHDRTVVTYALEKLSAFPQLELVGSLSPTERVGSVAFVYPGVHAHDVGQVLDSEGIAVRSGHHCTMPLHTKFGWPATTRISFNVYTSRSDIDALMIALHKVKQVFGK
jgi:cysteine desulfurase/selenocysteine lyase